MEFLLLFTTSDAPSESDVSACMAEMGQMAQGLAREGMLRRGFPLHPTGEAATVRANAGRPFVIDGPFAESKEQLGGAWVIDVPSRDAAIEIARRVPLSRFGSVEVHRLRFRYHFLDAGEGAPFLLAFHQSPDHRDPGGSKMRAMVAHGRLLEKQGILIETAPLANDPPAARVIARNQKVLVTDGPFAETKDVVGGYSIVRAADRAAAIELAKQYPAASWGPVEVREILYFDAT